MVSTFALTSVEYSASGNVGNIVPTICLLDGKCTTWSRLDGILAVLFAVQYTVQCVEDAD